MPTINGLKFELDDEFRQRNRRHTDQERMNLGILIEGEGCLADALTVAQIGAKLILCDGYTTLGICEEKGIKPTAPRLIPFPDRQSVLEWIDRRAEGRRNLTAEELSAKAEARRKRVSDGKADGMSNRALAEQEGVDEKTIRKDVAASSGADPSAPEPSKSTTPTPASVTGKDGKQYPANQESKVFCRECRIRGPKKGCRQCAEKRQGTAVASRSKGSNGKPKKPGDEMVNWKELNKHYGYVFRGIDEVKTAYGACDEAVEAEALLRQFRKVWEGWRKRVLKIKKEPAAS